MSALIFAVVVVVVLVGCIIVRLRGGNIGAEMRNHYAARTAAAFAGAPQMPEEGVTKPPTCTEIGPLEDGFGPIASEAPAAAPVQVVKQSLTTDGWIPWEGGECPVPKNAAVEVRFRCGGVNPQQKAYVWRWTNTGGDYDIVAYRPLFSFEQRPMIASMETAIAETGEWLREPERDDCQLIPRDELARLQEAYSIGVRYCKNPASQSNFERLAKAHGVEL